VACGMVGRGRVVVGWVAEGGYWKRMGQRVGLTGGYVRTLMTIMTIDHHASGILFG